VKDPLRRSESRAGVRTATRTASVTLALAAITGLALRVWAMSPPLGMPDGDEAVWGLMSMHVLDGEVPTFFWAQEYGGTQEVLLTSVGVAIAGPSLLAIRIVPILLFAAGVWLTREIGRETIGEPAATYAAAFLCVWPAYVVWKSTRAHGFYGSGIVLGLAILLLLLRLRARDSWPLYAALGLALGLGLWATPQVGLLAIPGVVWLVAHRPTALRGTPVALPFALLGALPWILWNLKHDWASFDRAVEHGAGRYPDRVHSFLSPLLPEILGLRAPFSLDWIPGAALGWALLAAAAAGFVWLAVGRREGITILLLAAAVYPFLFALSPFAWFQSEPRYLVLLAPVLALLAARLLGGRRLAPLVVAALALLSVGGLANMDDAFAVTADGLQIPDDRDPLVHALDRARVRHVLADYNLAYILTFETDERIVAAPTGQPRYVPQWKEVHADPRRAYVTVAGSRRDRLWRAELANRRRETAGGFAVYLPEG
jgi:Dolichyl-phosphate-mannose-protein mannosyltransferase